LVAIIGRDPRYRVCGTAHTFEEANKLVRQHRPDAGRSSTKGALRISPLGLP
jgi:hypothetical protein